MRVIAAAFGEIWRLFVDDGAFAAAIILWPCLIWLRDRRDLLSGIPGSTLLALGMIVILVAGTMRNRHPGGSK